MKPELARKIDRTTGGLIKPDYDPYFFSPSAIEIVRFMGKGWQLPPLHSDDDGRTVQFYDANLRTGALRLYIKPEEVRLDLELFHLEATKAEATDLSSRSDVTIRNPDVITLHEDSRYPEHSFLRVDSRYCSLTIDRSLRIKTTARLSQNFGDYIMTSFINLENLLQSKSKTNTE